MKNAKSVAFTINRLLVLSMLGILFTVTDLNSQQTLTDSLKNEWSEVNIDSNQLEFLLEFSYQTSKKDLEEALALARYGITLSQAKKEDIWLVKFHYNEADFLQKLSLYDEALDAINKSIAYSQAAGDTKLMAKSMSTKAVVEIDKGNYHEGMNIYMKVLDIHKLAGDHEGIGSSYSSLSEILFFLENYKESTEYGQKAIEIFEAIGDKKKLAVAYEITALSLMGNEQEENGLKYMNQAIALGADADLHPQQIGSIQNSRGNILRELERYEESLAAFQIAYQIATDLNYKGGMAATMGNIGDVYYLMGKTKKALPYKREAVLMKEKIGQYINYSENLLQLSTLYKEIGDFENALLYHEKVLTFRDSTFNKDKEAITQELTTRYETKQKEEQIAQNEREQNFLYAILASMLLGVGFLIWAYIQKQRSNKILQALNEQKAFLIKEVHHRVKNNLQVISSLLQFQSRSIIDKDIKAALLDSQSRVRSMSLIHQKLYRGTHLAAIEMKSYLGSLAETLIDAYADDESIDITLDMEAIELDVDYAIPLGLIANELVTNSLKYAFPNNRQGTVNIKLQQQASNLILLVSDNGVGKSMNIKQDPNNGFGSELIDMLSLQLKGELVESFDAGFQVKFRFPYKKTA